MKDSADLNDRPINHLGLSRRTLLEAIERDTLLPCPPNHLPMQSGGAATLFWTISSRITRTFTPSPTAQRVR